MTTPNVPVGQQVHVNPTGIIKPDLQARSPNQLLNSPYFYGFKTTNLTRWIDAVRAMSSGYSPVVQFIGDSTVAGAGAGTGGTSGYIDAKRRSIEMKLAAALRARGYSARAMHYCGDNNVRASGGITYDATAGTSFFTGLTGTGITYTQTSMGGFVPKLTSAVTPDKLSWTPPHAFDRITITYLRNTTLGTASVNVDGGASLGSIVSAGSAGMGTATFSCTEGLHTVNITLTTAGTGFYPHSIRCWSTARPSIDIVNAGWGGATAATWTDTASAWSTKNALILNPLGADLTIIKLMTNDVNGATTVGTYQTQMTDLITAVKQGGSSVIVLSNDPIDSGNVYNGKQATFIAALRDTVCPQLDVPFVDLNAYMGPYFEQPAAQVYNSLHPSETGYAVEASLVAGAMLHMI